VTFMDQPTLIAPRARARRGRALGPGRLFKRGAQWSLDFRTADGRRSIVALSTDRRAAERIRSERIHQRDLERAGLTNQAGQEKPLAEIVREYLVDLRPRVSPRHGAMVAARLDALLARLGPIRVADLRALDVVRVRNQLAASGAAPRTANLVVDSLNAALRWAEQHEIVGRNPLARIKRLPDGPGYARRRRRALSDEEVARLLAEVDREDARLGEMAAVDGRVRVPQAPLFAWLVSLGTRYSETIALRWADVDLADAVVVLRAETTKSRRQRVLPLGDEQVAMLRGLQAVHARLLGRLPTAGEPVFRTPEGAAWCARTNNIARVLHRVLRRAGIRRVGVDGTTVDLHALRHTAASRWARRGVPLAVAQRMLGHQDVRLTASVYTHVGVEELRVAVRGEAREAGAESA